MNRTENTHSDVLIKRIDCPELDSVEFASDLETAFVNINNNFQKLSNHDFIKGDMGSSVKIVSTPIYTDGELTDDICKGLHNFIESLLEGKDPVIKYPIDEENEIMLNYYDNFTPDNAGYIQVIYNTVGDSIVTEDVPVSSLQYVFLDGRFWNDKVGKIDASIFDEIDDMSCIITYDKDNGFKSLGNSLPTMYYEKNIGLCWKINGKFTGMPIKGLPGKDGGNALIRIVKVNSLSTPEEFEYKEGEVKSIFESYTGYINVEDLTVEDFYAFDNSSAIIINDDESKLYIGSLGIKTIVIDEETGETKDILYATCDPNTSLNDINSYENVKNALKSIKLTNNDVNALKGLFIPIDTTANQVHLISASSIINTEGIDTLKNNDLIFTPVNDIDNLNVNESDDKSLKVDKYLYLQINKNSDIFKTDAIKALCEKYNYYLKYKLKTIITDINDEWLKPTSDNFSSVETSDGTKFLSDTNVVYLSKSENGELEIVTDYKDSLKNDFAKNNLYLWEIQYDANKNYDIDELLNIAPDGYADIPKQFKYICTNTFTPGISTDILWFNTLETCTGVANSENDKFNNNYVVPGWCIVNDELFKVIKFVPIYMDEAFHVNDDTAINFNYNVNITGCDHNGSDSKRNLTVHGDINCDNINVYKLTATGEIDNVYTKNTIIGDSGIKLCKDGDKHKFEVLVNGDIVTEGNLDCPIVNTDLLEAPVINNANDDVTGNIVTNKLKLLGKTSDTSIEKFVVDTTDFDDKSQKLYDNRLNVKFNDINNIDITKRRVTDRSTYEDNSYNKEQYEQELKSNVSRVKTNTPIVMYDKSNIVVTNNNPEDVFIDENISNYTYEKFKQAYGDIDGEGDAYAVSKDMINNLFDKPNSYEINKKIIEFNIDKEFSGTSSNSNIISYELKSVSNKLNTGAFDQYSDIYSYDPKPTSSWSKDFKLDDGLSNLEKMAIAQFEIEPDKDDNTRFDIANRINIILPKLQFGLGFYSHCSNGNWTIFKDGKMYLKCIVQSRTPNGKVTRINDTTSYEYKFKDTGITWTREYAKYTQKGGSAPSSGSSSYETWRFKAYTVNPKPFSLHNITTMQRIYDEIENGNTIIVTIYPEFYISVDSENFKKKSLADDCMILRLAPIGPSTQSNIITTNSTYLDSIKYQDIYSKLEYKIHKVKVTTSDSCTTVVCNDGILINTGSSVFGMGLGLHSEKYGVNEELVPELYFRYIETNNNGKPVTTTKQIKLKDLFAKLDKIDKLDV